MGRMHEVQRYCDDCDEWRPVRVAQKTERNPNVKCRKHMARRPPQLGKRLAHTATGYVLVRTPDGWVYEHRYVWEQSHGPIPDGYHVHHVNHVRNDNRIENLELVLGRRHNKDHTQERHNERTLDNRGRRGGMWLAELDNDEIVRRRDSGETFRSIARDMGVSRGTIANHYRRALEGLA